MTILTDSCKYPNRHTCAYLVPGWFHGQAYLLESTPPPTEAEVRYELEEEFKQYIVEDVHGNPIDWFNKLDKINSKLSNIEVGKFQKDEEDIKLHIRMKFPEDL